MVTAEDVVVAYSNSGETGEILNILPSLKRIGAKLIAVVGNAHSTLAENADVVLDAGVLQEADSSDWLRPVQRQRHWHLAMLWQWRLWKKRILLPINLRYFIRADLWENVCL